MNQNFIKPPAKDLRSNLEQYCIAVGPSPLEKEFLEFCCERIDNAFRLVTNTALQVVPQAVKCSTFPQLTASQTPMPAAIQIGQDIYRIAFPISFVHRLIKTAPTRNGASPSCTNDYYFPSLFIACFAAFAHELNHVFTGHLSLETSIAQETNSDFIGGGLTWAWLNFEEIKNLYQPSCTLEDDLVYGVLHLISILSDSDPSSAGYLPRVARFGIYTGGAAYYADNSGDRLGGDRIDRAKENIPNCPESTFSSKYITDQWMLLSQPKDSDDKILDLVKEVFRQIALQKRTWFNESKHLRPIARDLHRSVKRDAK